jgi:hypothetical protein
MPTETKIYQNKSKQFYPEEIVIDAYIKYKKQGNLAVQGIEAGPLDL